jgi:hypothetical protein
MLAKKMTHQFSLAGQLIGAQSCKLQFTYFKLSCFCNVSLAIKDAVKRPLK